MNNLTTSIMIKGNNRAEQAMLNSQRYREVLRSNLYANPNIKPVEVVVESNDMQQTIYVNPNQNYQNIKPTVVMPSIVAKARINLDSIEGILLKKSPHFVMGYAKKYCVLKNRNLYYYHPDKRDQLEGSLNFDLQEYIFTSVKNEKGRIIEFKLVPKGHAKEFIFKSEFENDTDRWALQVSLHVQQSEGIEKHLTSLTKTPYFWKQSQYSHLQILDEADDGDILLFKTKDVFSAAARVVMGSESDHVAVCYRDNGSVWVYEAVQSGVGAFLFSYLKLQDWYKFYEKVCYRKLNYSKKKQLREKYIEFIKNNLGAEYSINLGKLMTFQSKIVTQKPKPESSNIPTEEKKRSYFCSELVAKSYKEFGLLDPIKSSTQYHPIDFTQSRKLELLENASLGPEQLILFEV